MKDEAKLDSLLEAEFAEDTMDLKAKLQKITGTQEVAKKKSALRLLMPIIAVAAGLALAVIFLPALFTDSSTDGLYAAHYEPYPMALNQRGDGDVSVNEAIANYSEGEYVIAAEKFKELYDTSGDNVQLLYAASAEQATGNYQTAIDLYDKILASSDAKVSEQAQWYKALSLLKMGEVDAGKNLLKSFPESHYKFSEAQKITK